MEVQEEHLWKEEVEDDDDDLDDFVLPSTTSNLEQRFMRMLSKLN